jgi:hypothetical protein
MPVIPTLRLAILRREINSSFLRIIRSGKGRARGGPYFGDQEREEVGFKLDASLQMRLQGINHPRLCTSSDRPLRSLSQLAVPNITGAEDSPYLGGESWSAPQIGPNEPHMARTSIHHTIIHVSQHQILRIPKQINQISHKQDTRREAEKHLSGNRHFSCRCTHR